MFCLRVKNDFVHYVIESGMFVAWLLYAIGAKNAFLNNRVARYQYGDLFGSHGDI